MARTLQVDIVTPERSLFSGQVNMVTLPGAIGQMGILPGHAPLLTTLDIGEIILHTGNVSQFIAVSGGVVEVRPDKVTILADTAETPEDIDADRAQQALDRAQQLLATNPPPHERPLVEAAMRRSTLRLRVARKHQGRRVASSLSFEETANKQQ
jgi:F-type H+-transporting ATPase subunit epsilon